MVSWTGWTSRLVSFFVFLNFGPTYPSIVITTYFPYMYIYPFLVSMALVHFTTDYRNFGRSTVALYNSIELNLTKKEIYRPIHPIYIHQDQLFGLVYFLSNGEDRFVDSKRFAKCRRNANMRLHRMIEEVLNDR